MILLVIVGMVKNWMVYCECFIELKWLEVGVVFWVENEVVLVKVES